MARKWWGMTLVQAAILGVVQGITEFLPVSSSAHLVICQNFFGLEGPILLVFDIVVHVGTLLSLVLYFGRDFLKWKRGQARQTIRAPGPFSMRLFWLVVVATIPTAGIGLFLKDWMERSFNSLWITVVTLVINSFILWSTRWVRSWHKAEVKNWLDALWIGIAQGISILPGISRSGATVASALWLRIKPDEAARFSFLIAIPAILGATIFVLPEAIPFVSHDLWGVISVGFLSAFISGYLAIAIVFKVIARGQFHYFAVYTFLLALVTALYTYLQ